MKTLLLLTTLLFASCSSVPQNYFVGYVNGAVEISGMKGDLTGAGYDLKLKKAYLLYADGNRTSLNITGAGFGANQLALYLEGGGKIVIDLQTGTIASGSVPSFK